MWEEQDDAASMPDFSRLSMLGRPPVLDYSTLDQSRVSDSPILGQVNRVAKPLGARRLDAGSLFASRSV